MSYKIYFAEDTEMPSEEEREKYRRERERESEGERKSSEHPKEKR